MRKPLVHGRTNNGLYEWPVSHPQAHIISTSSPLTTWRQRLGHPHSRVLRFILNKFSLPFHERDKNFHCNSCLSNKVHRNPFTQLSLSSSKPLQTIFSDLWGHRQSYLLTKSCIFVDQYTKYTWLYTLTKKSEVKEIFQKFHPMMEKH
uniref:Putative ovule protein n=1 Tax=Solanum chacoense TaxID=4108 RepID=A0A0V0HX97_SOLCH